MKHLTVCVLIRGERYAFIISGPTFTKLEKQAEQWRNRIGYVGDDSFAMAVKRVGIMERDEPGAWGPLEAAA